MDTYHPGLLPPPPVHQLPPRRAPNCCVGCASTNCVRLHYGAPSCHGCKAFFRRTVFNGRVYVCNGSNTCNTSNEARNSCRACRINSCLRGGMNPKFVREERMRGMLDSPEDGIFSEMESDRWARVVPSPVQTSNNAYYGLVRYLGALEKEAEMNIIGGINVGSLSSTSFTYNRYPMDWSCTRKSSAVDIYSQWSRTFLLHTDWCMGIQEYRALSISDQTILFKANFPSFSWITYAYKCHVNKVKNKGIPLGNGSYIPYDDEERTHLDPMRNECYGRICQKLIDEVVLAMAELNITFEEYCLIKTIALFQTDNELTVEGMQHCSQFRNKLQETLSFQISSTFSYLSPINKSNRALKLASMLPSLVHVGYLEMTMIKNFGQESDIQALTFVSCPC